MHDYIARTAGIAPPQALVHRVFEETEGNAFFLSEVVNLMTQEGTLTATPLACSDPRRRARGARAAA